MKMTDPFETTPAGFHLRIEQKLNELQRQAKPARPSYRLAAVLVMCAVLLGGTALALDRLGVLYFLTQRVWMGTTPDQTAVVQPIRQSCEGGLLNAVIQDAYWDGETLSVTMQVSAAGDYAFYTETDVGQDGEHFDQIWWQGEILSFEEWKAGRPEVMLHLPELMYGGENITRSWDWVQDGKGETMLLDGQMADMTQGGVFSIVLNGRTENGDVQSVLTFELPPMTKGETQE